MDYQAEALRYLEHALRDLDRAADRLARLEGMEPESRASKKAADLVADIAAYVRRPA